MSPADDWIARFRAKHGRPPAVLHIGNIANNAYCIAKLLRESGLECDVLCRDYYHVMGCPEWEDADFVGEIGDQFNPDWDSVDLRGFVRPEWFVSGPTVLAMLYLMARRDGRRLRARFWWWTLGIARGAKTKARRHPRLAALLESWGAFVVSRSTLVVVLSCLFFPLLLAHAVLMRTRFRPWVEPRRAVDERGPELVELFAKTFPARPDKLAPGDLATYPNVTESWRALFERYDLVQGYALEPILPLIAGKRPFTAFEHGTLRDFTQGDQATHRLCSLAYNQADHVFITNGDCLDYAKKIGVERYSPMLHPVDERRVLGSPSSYDELHARYGAEWLLLCPLRHDWKVKGTDGYVRALPALRGKFGDRFKLLMTTWGGDLEASRKLAAELGVESSIVWIEPVHHSGLYRLLRSVDVLCDQLHLPVFGSTAPEGIAAGLPTIMSYDPAYTTWLLPEPAPILRARHAFPDEIVAAVEKALDPAWRADYKARAAAWVEKCHSIRTVRERHLEVYGRLLSEPTPPS